MPVRTVTSSPCCRQCAASSDSLACGAPISGGKYCVTKRMRISGFRWQTHGPEFDKPGAEDVGGKECADADIGGDSLWNGARQAHGAETREDRHQGSECSRGLGM